jgi:nucleolar protein 15
MLDFDVIEAKKETPKKEAPKPKATKAKKGKKAQEETVEEVEAEVDAVVTEDGHVEDAAEDDDQTAALLAGFSSDDSDPEDDEDFPADSAVVPKLTKSQKKAIARAKDTPKATEPGVIYVG